MGNSALTKVDYLKGAFSEKKRDINILKDEITSLKKEAVKENNIYKKKALITGITGQDGSYLAEFLAEKGYEVYGFERRKALEDQSVKRKTDAEIIAGDITNYSSVFSAIQKVMPDEIYHLAAQSDVAHSFKDPFQTLDTNVMGTINVLEAMKILTPKGKLYFAGSSEMFGKAVEEPQNESTKFHPRSPYGVSKCAGFHLCQNYREAYDLFICNGILFNHESPRRGKEFVTRKITSAIRMIKEGKQDKLMLGNLDSKRDWGYAKDYVEAMWLMLQQDKPQDYVVATNETHTIREFVNEAFKIANLNPEKYVKIDSDMFRPSDVVLLRGNYSKAEKELGWKPKVKFNELVKMMVKADLKGI
jgi:GDPmannose 4,6-dehydratase